MKHGSTCQSQFTPGTHSSYPCSRTSCFLPLFGEEKNEFELKNLGLRPACIAACFGAFSSKFEVILNRLEQLPFGDWLCLSVCFC